MNYCRKEELDNQQERNNKSVDIFGSSNGGCTFLNKVIICLKKIFYSRETISARYNDCKIGWNTPFPFSIEGQMGLIDISCVKQNAALFVSL